MPWLRAGFLCGLLWTIASSARVVLLLFCHLRRPAASLVGRSWTPLRSYLCACLLCSIWASNLETRSTELATQARAFHATSRQARRHMWWQLCKQRIFIGTACGGLLLIFILVIAGQAGAFSGGDDGEEATTLPSPSPPSL